ASLSPVDITVQYSGGASALTSADLFTYTAPDTAIPTITGLDLPNGPEAGGTVITISGTNFNNVSAVNFGSTPAAQFLVTSSTSILAVSPVAASAGPVDIS